MFENYSENLFVLGSVGASLFTYYYLTNYIFTSNSIKIEKIKDFDYSNNQNNITLVNKSGLYLKIIGGKDYNINMINKIIKNNDTYGDCYFQKIFLDLYKKEECSKDFLGNSFISFIEGSDGIYLYDSNNNLVFSFNEFESNIKENKYVFEIKAPNLFNINEILIEKDYNKKIQILS